jgi:hypothetical protein
MDAFSQSRLKAARAVLRFSRETLLVMRVHQGS